jgi:uncharacterized protein GlcG (DUF336 family)
MASTWKGGGLAPPPSDQVSDECDDRSDDHICDGGARSRTPGGRVVPMTNRGGGGAFGWHEAIPAMRFFGHLLAAATRSVPKGRRRTGRLRARAAIGPGAAGLGSGCEPLEPRAMLAAAQLTTAEVGTLLDRASAATPRNDAIIAVVDRTGQILGVRTEADVPTADVARLAFMIDGAVAKARTGAFFSNGQAILTSRTVSHISQSTITQREVEANPASADPLVQGPGYVAPVGIGGEFPPGVLRRPLVDLFAIEHTNRTSIVAGGVTVTNRDAWGVQSGLAPGTTSRGIATMPGGLGIYRLGTNDVIGGIGVFFPGPDGFATFEQSFRPVAAQTRTQRLNGPRALEAETIALLTLLPVTIPGAGLVTATLAPRDLIARAGGLGGPLPLSLAQAQRLVDRVNAAARINLGGVALQSFGPQAGPLGVARLFDIARTLGFGAVNGSNQPVAPGGVTLLPGQPQPDGWLVPATAGTLLSAADVTRLVEQGVAQARRTRAQIRAQPTFTRMVLAVADTDGTLLGVFRMPDATVFSIDVAVAKARNTAYYASPSLAPQDRVTDVPLGTAFTNRTFRYLAVPKYPSGSATAAPGPFSILNTPGIDPRSGLNSGAPLPASAFDVTVLGYDSFNPGTNFRAPTPAANQNGVVFFPGSTAAYRSGTLAGGYGISGDGVDQDDAVTFFGAAGFQAPAAIRADRFLVRSIRLPYIKFSRNVQAGLR